MKFLSVFIVCIVILFGVQDTLAQNNSTRVKALYRAAVIAFENKNYDAAYENVLKAENHLGREAPSSLSLKTRIEYFRGNYTQAQKHLNKLLDWQPPISNEILDEVVPYITKIDEGIEGQKKIKANINKVFSKQRIELREQMIRDINEQLNYLNKSKSNITKNSKGNHLGRKHIESKGTSGLVYQIQVKGSPIQWYATQTITKVKHNNNLCSVSFTNTTNKYSCFSGCGSKIKSKSSETFDFNFYENNQISIEDYSSEKGIITAENYGYPLSFGGLQIDGKRILLWNQTDGVNRIPANSSKKSWPEIVDVIKDSLDVIKRSCNPDPRLDKQIKRDIADNTQRNNKKNITELTQKNTADGTDECFFGGWPSFVKGKFCRHPESDFDSNWLKKRDSEGYFVGTFNLTYESCDDETQFRCSPLLFGTSKDAKGACIDHGPSYYALTEKCAYRTTLDDDFINQLLVTEKEALRLGRKGGLLSALENSLTKFCSKYAAISKEFYDHSHTCESMKRRLSDIRERITEGMQQ